MTTITTRAAKGEPLTHEELDNNFTNLNTDKLEDITAENLANLSDVNVTPTDGQSLTWDNATSTWIATTPAGGGGGDLPVYTGDTDTDISISATGTGTVALSSGGIPITIGKHPSYDEIELASNGTDQSINLRSRNGGNAYVQSDTAVYLNSVDPLRIKTGANNKQLYIQEGSDKVEIRVTDAGDALKLQSDTSNVKVVAGDKVQLYSVNGTYIINDTSGEAYSLPNSTPAQDQILKADGNGDLQWATESAGGGGASEINDLTDVSISTPSTNQVLKYNGANWVNGTDDSGGGSGGGNLQANLTLDYDMNAGDVVYISGDGTVGKVGNQTITESPNPDAIGNVGGVPPTDYTGADVWWVNNNVPTAFDNVFSAITMSGVVWWGMNPDGTTWGKTGLYYNNPDEGLISVKATHIGTNSYVYFIGQITPWGDSRPQLPGACVMKVPYFDNNWTSDQTGIQALDNNAASNGKVYSYINPITLRYVATWHSDSSLGTNVYIGYGSFNDQSTTIDIGTPTELRMSGINPNILHGEHSISPVITSNGTPWLVYLDKVNGSVQCQKLIQNDTDWSITADQGSITQLLSFSRTDIYSIVPDPHNPDHYVIPVVKNSHSTLIYFSIINDVVQVVHAYLVVQDLRNSSLFEFHPTDSTKGFFVGKDGNGVLHATNITIDRQTNTLAAGTSSSFGYWAPNFGRQFCYIPDNTDQILMAYSDADNVTALRRFVETSTTTISNINDVTPDGILQESGTTGQSKPVNLLGSLSTIHSNLTTGSTYRVTDSGALSDQYGIHVIGEAISSTSILQIDAGDQIEVGGGSTDTFTIDGVAASTTIQNGDPYLNIRLADRPNTNPSSEETVFSAYRDHDATWGLNTNGFMNPYLALKMQGNASNEYNVHDWGWGGRNNVRLEHKVVANDEFAGNQPHVYDIFNCDPGHWGNSTFQNGRITFTKPIIAQQGGIVGWATAGDKLFYNLLIDNEHTPAYYAMEYDDNNVTGDFQVVLADVTEQQWIDQGPFRNDKLGFGNKQEFEFWIKIESNHNLDTVTVTNMFPDSLLPNNVVNINLPWWVDLGNNSITVPRSPTGDSVYIIKYRTFANVITREFIEYVG